MENNIAKNPHLERVIEMLTKMGLSYQMSESNDSLMTRLQTEEDDILPIVIAPVGDYWLTLSSWGLNQKSLVDDAALAKFYKALLKENDFTKLGKFYINEANHFEFSVDIRMAELSESLFEESINLIGYVVFERLPEIARPYVSYLFDISNNHPEHNE